MTEESAAGARLESLWSGPFGDEYTKRNADAYAQRGAFWKRTVAQLGCKSVLEVGCNVGGNLRWLAAEIEPRHVYGVDVNRTALDTLRAEVAGVNSVWSPARTLPFRDSWFDLVFTTGVLIHQPEDTLPVVMSEMVRCARRWILLGEYYAEQTTEVPYRGHDGALFRRDYGQLMSALFPELHLVSTDFLGRDQGWDDLTVWVFEKP